VTVFADTDECDVDGAGFQFLPHSFDYNRGIQFAVEQVVSPNARFSNEALHQISAEAGRMRFGKSYVLIEMEHLDALPVDAGSCSEELEEVELRSASRRDDPSAV